MTDRRIEKLTDFVEYLEVACEADNVLFRGQGQAHSLLPKIARPEIHSRTPTKTPVEIEKSIFDQFRRESVEYLPQHVEREDELLALAQHYGLPTRLLDWTRNPLAALWFCVRHPPRGGRDGVVWILNQDNVETTPPDDERKVFAHQHTTVFTPPLVVRRMTAQSALFTLHAYSPATGNFVALEDDAVFKPHLDRIHVPARRFSELRFQLDRCGMNAASMFPDLEGLCEHIQWQNTLLADEDTAEGGTLSTD